MFIVTDGENGYKEFKFTTIGGALAGLCNIQSIELTKQDIEKLIKEIKHNPKQLEFYFGNLLLKMRSELRGTKADQIIIDDPTEEV